MQRRSFLIAALVALCVPLKRAFGYLWSNQEPVIKVIPLTYDGDTFGRIEHFIKADGKQEMLLFVNDNIISRTTIDPNDHNEAVTIVCNGKSPVRAVDIDAWRTRVMGPYC